MPKKSIVAVFIILCILGTATFVITKPYKTSMQANRPARTAGISALIDDGKAALYSHDVPTAKAKFLEALNADPTDQEANMLYGVVRILSVYEEGQDKNTPGLDSIREIAELAGLRFSQYGVYTTEIQSKTEKLAATTPKTGDALNYLKDKLLTEIDGAIVNLGRVTSIDFVSIVNPEALNKIGPTFNIDYADVVLMKAALYGAKATLELLLAYNLDIYAPQIQYGVSEEIDRLVAFRNILLYYPQFLAPKEPARLSSSKSAVISSIDYYVSGIEYVKTRTTTTNHLFVLDVPVEQITNEPVQSTTAEHENVVKTLADIRASLDGVREWQDSFPERPTAQRTFDLSKFFNPSSPVNFRQIFFNSNTNLFVSDNTVKGIMPYGISQFANSLTPVIYQSQESCYLGQTIIMWGRGFSPQNSVTISMINSDGTNAPNITLNTDGIGQFNYVFTVPTTRPEGIYQWRARDSQTGFQTEYLRLPVSKYKKTWESGSNGQGSGQFSYPAGIAVKNSEVFVADTGNDRIQVLNTDGSPLRAWGYYGNNSGQFNYPYGVAANPSGDIFVADTYNSRIQKFNKYGAFLSQFGTYGTGDTQFRYPMDIDVNSLGDVFVADSSNDRIQKFGADSSYRKWGQPGTGDGQFNWPNGIAIDTKNNVYVLDCDNARVQKFDMNGNFLRKWSIPPAEGQSYIYPAGISSDTNDNIIVGGGDGRIIRFTSDGNYITEWKSYNANGNRQIINGLATDNNNVYGTTFSSVVKFSPVLWSTLNVSKSGKGSGTVVSIPLGINCGSYCNNVFTSDNTVTLIGLSDVGSSVSTWTNCDQVVDNMCLVNMISSKSVKVEFTDAPIGPCSFSISATSKPVSYKGKTVKVKITAEGGGCAAPPVLSNDPWIAATLSSFENNKGTVEIVVSPNPSSIARTGTVTIGEYTFTVYQDGIPCKLSAFTPKKGSFASAGEASSFTVNTVAECQWTATVETEDSSWLSITGGAAGSGTGDVAYEVTANAGGKPRAGGITVTLTQTNKKKVFKLKQED